MRAKKINDGMYRGGEGKDSCDHGLSRRSLRAEGKASYGFGWRVGAMIKKQTNKQTKPM